MALLIAATDFSELADNAVHYACQLASSINAEVMVLHSFIIPVTFGDNPMPIMPVDEAKHLADDRMNSLTDRLRKAYPSLHITSKVTLGDVIDNLDDITDKLQSSLVVIGNSGPEDDMLWLGSNVVSAMRNLKIPVLAIPQDYSFKQPQKICYACDFKNMDASINDDLQKIISISKAQLHILNIGATLDVENMKNSFANLSPILHQVAQEDIDSAIASFINEHDMDWLIVVPHKHSFFGQLFHKSVTKALIKTSHIPVLALHEQH